MAFVQCSEKAVQKRINCDNTKFRDKIAYVGGPSFRRRPWPFGDCRSRNIWHPEDASGKSCALILKVCHICRLSRCQQMPAHHLLNFVIWKCFAILGCRSGMPASIKARFTVLPASYPPFLSFLMRRLPECKTHPLCATTLVLHCPHWWYFQAGRYLMGLLEHRDIR